jgi:hypothetical protein
MRKKVDLRKVPKNERWRYNKYWDGNPNHPAGMLRPGQRIPDYPSGKTKGRTQYRRRSVRRFGAEGSFGDIASMIKDIYDNLDVHEADEFDTPYEVDDFWDYWQQEWKDSINDYEKDIAKNEPRLRSAPYKDRTGSPKGEKFPRDDMTPEQALLMADMYYNFKGIHVTPEIKKELADIILHTLGRQGDFLHDFQKAINTPEIRKYFDMHRLAAEVLFTIWRNAVPIMPYSEFPKFTRDNATPEQQARMDAINRERYDAYANNNYNTVYITRAQKSWDPTFPGYGKSVWSVDSDEEDDD